MKNEGASNQFFRSKPIGEEDAQPIAVCPENRGKVARMFRMKTVIWIEMAICIGKRIIVFPVHWLPAWTWKPKIGCLQTWDGLGSPISSATIKEPPQAG